MRRFQGNTRTVYLTVHSKKKTLVSKSFIFFDYFVSNNPIGGK